MNIVPAKPRYVYTANQTAITGSLPKLMKVAFVTNSPSSIIQAIYDKKCTTECRTHASTQCDSTVAVHAVRYKLPTRRDEQVDRQNAVKELKENANSSW